MSINFTPTGWSDYVHWQNEDRKTLKKINDLIKSIVRDGALKGMGKPELLKNIEGYSRRIDDQNRLVYQMIGTSVVILACIGHYEK